MRFFDCWHTWFGLSGKSAELTITNGIDVSFTIMAQVCTNCPAVRWVRTSSLVTQQVTSDD